MGAAGYEPCEAEIPDRAAGTLLGPSRVSGMTSETTTLATPEGLVQIQAAPDRSRRAVARSAEHVAFLGDHWPSLKAAAWEGYRRHGAGAVVLWRDAAPRRVFRRPFEPERLWFTTQIHALPGTVEADFSGWEAERLEDYDPDREALVVFVEGGRPQGYVVRGSLGPSDARAQARASEN